VSLSLDWSLDRSVRKSAIAPLSCQEVLVPAGKLQVKSCVVMKSVLCVLQDVKVCAGKHRDVSGGGIYVGLGGVALTYLRMAQQVQRGFR